jgi:hypothetical protein
MRHVPGQLFRALVPATVAYVLSESIQTLLP